jgi:hypothetical protein
VASIGGRHCSCDKAREHSELNTEEKAMNKNYIQNSVKTYESIYSGSNASSQGKANSNSAQKKSQGSEEDFRAVLNKKLKSA